MKAAIEFSVYDNYTPYIEGEGDYSKAVEVLNNEIASLVEKKELTFKYGRKNVKILLPIEETQCGNIFDEEWEGIEIWCEIPDNVGKFDPDKLLVGKCPGDFAPKRVLY